MFCCFSPLFKDAHSKKNPFIGQKKTLLTFFLGKLNLFKKNFFSLKSSWSTEVYNV